MLMLYAYIQTKGGESVLHDIAFTSWFKDFPKSNFQEEHYHGTAKENG